jgi:hypothetical protein
MHHVYIPVRKPERPHRKFLFGMVIFLKVFFLIQPQPARFKVLFRKTKNCWNK